MTYPVANRMSSIAPFHVMDVLARARRLESAGRKIIHLEVGEPDFTTIEPIIEAGRKALAQGKTHYTPAVGLMQLREAIAAYYKQRYEENILPDRVVITPGASGALQLALGVTINPDDGVLMADPGYPCNRHMVAMYGGEIQAIAVNAETDFQLTKELVQQHWQDNSRVVMLASPSNPTGTLVAFEEIKAICAWVASKDGLVIVDEIYHGLVYADHPGTAFAAGSNVIVINSFSKYFGMTGWRLGWLVAPQDLIDPMDRLAQNIFLAAPTIAQHAAIVALSNEVRPLLDERRDEFQRRRDFLMPALQEIGFDIEAEPQGAFYLYANCSRFTDDSMQFSRDLLEQVGIALTPGADFGFNKSEEYIRFSYTMDIDLLKQAVGSIKKFIK